MRAEFTRNKYMKESTHTTSGAFGEASKYHCSTKSPTRVWKDEKSVIQATPQHTPRQDDVHCPARKVSLRTSGLVALPLATLLPPRGLPSPVVNAERRGGSNGDVWDVDAAAAVPGAAGADPDTCEPASLTR